MAREQVVWLVILCATVIADVKASSSPTAGNESSWYLAERRLRGAVMGHEAYSVTERPVDVPGQPVQVNVSLSMYAFISLEEKEQTLTGASWLIMKWADCRIRWDPEDYGNMRFLSLGSDEIWTPKILLTNTASEKIENPIRESVFRALVLWDGTVTLEGPIIHKTSCPMELSQFPFDRQNCSLTFSTQNIPDCLVNLNLGKAHIGIDDNYTQWRVLDLVGEESVQWVDKEEAGRRRAYARINFYFAAERLPNHYLLNVALPSGILTCISLGVFWLPPESGEKISMGVSLLLGQAVFWLVVADSLPPTGDRGTPLLLTCIEVNFVVGGLAILLSVLTLNVHSQSGPLKGRFLRKLLLSALPRVLCVWPCRNGQVGDRLRSASDRRQLQLLKTPVEGIKSVCSSATAEPGKGGELYSNFDKVGAPGDTEVNPDTTTVGPHNGSEDMKFAAVVLDRFFFVVTAVIFICGNGFLITKCVSTSLA